MTELEQERALNADLTMELNSLVNRHERPSDTEMMQLLRRVNKQFEREIKELRTELSQYRGASSPQAQTQPEIVQAALARLIMIADQYRPDVIRSIADAEFMTALQLAGECLEAGASPSSPAAKSEELCIVCGNPVYQSVWAAGVNGISHVECFDKLRGAPEKEK